MDDTTLLIGIVLVLAYLIVMPVAVAIVFKRSARLQQWNVQLEQTVVQLQANLARLTAQVNRLNPTVTPTLPASSVRTPASADTVDAPVEPDVSGENGDNPNEVTMSQKSNELTTLDPSSHQDTATRREVIAVEKHSGILSSLAAWLLQGNPLAKIGILLLFFGLAYLMKYTIERDMLSIQWRLGVAALISGGLLAFGWRLRHKQRLYALILQGGAVGALYITIFGAFRLYLLLPYPLAFALLLLVCAASVGLAVIQRSLSLAMLASIGGYLAPILLSQGGGNHVVLFSYYLLLSLGILAISARQSWRELNLLGLIFTFGVAATWGAKYYQQDFYLSSQLFLIANILLFGVGALLFSLRHQSVGKQVVDGVLLFAPPLIGFGMQYLITGHWKYGPAGSALAYGLGYLVLGGLTRKRLPRLGLFAFALGGCFLTLAVPLTLTGQSTALVWMLEGLCILWAGLHQNQRRMGRSGSAVLLFGAASVAYAAITGELQSAAFFFTFFTFGILAVASLCASLFWSRYRQVDGRWSSRFDRVFFILGLAAWLIWLVYIVERAMTAYTDAFWHGSEFMPPWRTQALLQSPLFLLLFAVSGLLWSETGRRLKWPLLRHSAWLLWGFMLLAVLQQLVFADYRQFPLLNGGEQIAVWACWLGSFTVAYRLLYRETGNIPCLAERVFHLALFWMAIGWLFLMADQYWYSRIPADMEEGAPILTVILLSAIILALVLPARHRLWPLTCWATLYNQTGLVPLVATLFTLSANANLLDGQIQWGSLTWPYVPFLNPLEISLFLGVTALARWYRRAMSVSAQSRAWKSRCRLALWGLIIWLLNGLLLRALAWYAQIPWSVDWLWDSRLVQTTFALLWTLAALVCMVWSTRRQQRGGWIMGALLLALTIIKLFLVDSAGGGGLARAIAFIGVAILILIVGYFAPLPPKKAMSQ